MVAPTMELTTDVAAPAKSRTNWLGVAGILAMIGAQIFVFLTSPPDRDMGHLQKIMYVHVPAAWNAFLAYFVVAIASLRYLWKGRPSDDLLASSAAEVGALLTGLPRRSTACIASKPSRKPYSVSTRASGCSVRPRRATASSPRR